MRFKKKWRNIVGIAAIMGMLLSQFNILSVLAEGTQVTTGEITIERKLEDGTTTQEDGTVSVGEGIILEISDTSESNTFITVPLGDNFVYNETLTTQVNGSHEDATITYESSANSVHISWNEEDADRNVSLAITAAKVSDNEIYAETIRDNHEYRSESVRLNVQDAIESNDEEATDSRDSSGTSSEEYDATSDDEELDTSNSEVEAESSGDVTVESNNSESDNSDSEAVTESSSDTTANSKEDIEPKGSDLKSESMLSARVGRPKSIGNITTYPGATVVGDSVVTIDSKYSFYPTYINEVTTATVNGRSISPNKAVTLTSADKKAIQQGTFVAEYRGAGYYKGRLIDVVMEVSSDNYTAPSSVNLTLNFNGYMMAWQGLYNSTFDIKYRFFDNGTGESVSITGFFTYVDIDCDEWYAIEKKAMKDIYVTSNSKVNYANDDKYFYALASSSGDLGVPTDKFLWLQFTYEDVSEMNISMYGSYMSHGILNSGLFYSSNSLVKISRPSPNIIGDDENSDVTDNVVEYKVIQEMPYRDGSLGYPNKVVLTGSYEEVLEDPTDVTITTLAGTNIASYFDIKVSKGEIIATLKNKKAAIYGNTFIMTYSSTPKEGADLFKYLKDGSCQLPAKATLDDGETTKESNIAYASLPLSNTTEGELKFISAPNVMNFGSNLEISSKEEVYQLESNDGELIVQDSRGIGNVWSMTAKLITELTSESGYELLDSLYYMNSGQEQAFSTHSSILIYDAVTENSDPVVISSTWEGSDGEVKGPVLKVKPGQARSESYRGEIQWILQDVPGNN